MLLSKTMKSHSLFFQWLKRVNDQECGKTVECITVGSTMKTIITKYNAKGKPISRLINVEYEMP